MSTFGEHLRVIVDSNKVNIYGLAKSAGIERTVIHKIMSGGRIPSDDYVFKLADALPLSPEERQRFMESYNISKIGEFKYRQRIQVKNLIESISYIENGTVNPVAAGVNSLPPSESSTTAIGYFAVNSLVKSVIEEAMTDEGKPTLDFVIPESYQYFYNELLACYLRNPQLCVRHIVTFTKKVDFMDNSNRNLSLLSHVLPFAFAPGTGYYPYYFYRASYDVELTQAMPYFILTSSNRLVLINRDFNKAAFICDGDIVGLYKESFSAMLEQAKPLIKRLNNISEVLGFCIDTDIDNVDAPSHWIEPEPCIGPLITDDMVNEQISRNLPDRDELVRMVCKHYGFLRENQLRNINVCTTDGLYRIINSGYIYYASTEIMNPISRDRVKELLNILKDRIGSNKVKLLFTNPSKITVPSKTLLCINRKTGINFIMYDSAISDFRAICLSEDSVNEAFADFVESIEDSGLVYNEGDSLATLNSIIEGI